jgi:hypothetical protein
MQVEAPAELVGFAQRAAEINHRQAREEPIIEDARAFVAELADRFGSAGGAPGPADEQDEILFYQALTDAQAALAAGDRRRMRIALQRLQDALAQIVDNEPVRLGRDANEVARWLASSLADVSRQRIAATLGVDRRTFTRWISEDGTRPVDDDARKLRTMAWTVNLLLRGLTPSGTVTWFELPNDELGGEVPAHALQRFDAQPRLRRAAYALLGGDAS